MNCNLVAMSEEAFRNIYLLGAIVACICNTCFVMAKTLLPSFGACVAIVLLSMFWPLQLFGLLLYVLVIVVPEWMRGEYD